MRSRRNAAKHPSEGTLEFAKELFGKYLMKKLNDTETGRNIGNLPTLLGISVVEADTIVDVDEIETVLSVADFASELIKVYQQNLDEAHYGPLGKKRATIYKLANQFFDEFDLPESNLSVRDLATYLLCRMRYEIDEKSEAVYHNAINYLTELLQKEELSDISLANQVKALIFNLQIQSSIYHSEKQLSKFMFSFKNMYEQYAAIKGITLDKPITIQLDLAATADEAAAPEPVEVPEQPVLGPNSGLVDFVGPEERILNMAIEGSRLTYVTTGNDGEYHEVSLQEKPESKSIKLATATSISQIVFGDAYRFMAYRNNRLQISPMDGHSLLTIEQFSVDQIVPVSSDNVVLGYVIGRQEREEVSSLYSVEKGPVPTKRLSSEDGITSMTALSDEFLLCTTGQGYVLAYHTATGKSAWVMKDADTYLQCTPVMSAINQSLLVAQEKNHQDNAFGADDLLVIDLTGLSEHDFESEVKFTARVLTEIKDTFNEITQIALIGENRFVVADDSTLASYQVNSEDETAILMSMQRADNVTALLADGEKLYCARGSNIYMLDPAELRFEPRPVHPDRILPRTVQGAQSHGLFSGLRDRIRNAFHRDAPTVLVEQQPGSTDEQPTPEEVPGGVPTLSLSDLEEGED